MKDPNKAAREKELREAETITCGKCLQDYRPDVDSHYCPEETPDMMSPLEKALLEEGY